MSAYGESFMRAQFATVVAASEATHDSTWLPFGALQPRPHEAWWLSTVHTGLIRGPLAKAMRRRWIAHHVGAVDVERQGLKFRLDPAVNITDGKILWSSRRHDRVELRALAGAASGGCFVDVGANIGYYALQLAKAGAARVIAIEPNPVTLARLRFHIANNTCGRTIDVAPFAVGPSGRFELFLPPHNLGEASLCPPASGSADLSVDSMEVETLPLLDLLRRYGVDRVDAMKVDIEGFEYAALAPYFAAAPEALKPRCLVVEHCHLDAVASLFEDTGPAGDQFGVPFSSADNSALAVAGLDRAHESLFALLERHGYRTFKRVRKNTILMRQG